MRFLKNKIAKATQALRSKQKSLCHQEKNTYYKEEALNLQSVSTCSSPHSSCSSKESYGSQITPLKTRATKSIAKNYGKAICSFSCSELAIPYLDPLLKQENTNRADFIQFMKSAKRSIESLQSFRSLLLITAKDDIRTASFKKIFGLLGEVFIKFFSVNWIFSGKILHKESHLQFRFKMLRRIKNPQFFTYLK